MSLVRRAWLSFAAATARLSLCGLPPHTPPSGFQGLSAAPANPNAGANSDVNIHIGFTGATDDVKDLTVGLPPGLVGNPTATPLCTLTQLQGDTCPRASQVGTVTAKVTAHLADPLPLTLPLTVNGSLYNVEPLRPASRHGSGSCCVRSAPTRFRPSRRSSRSRTCSSARATSASTPC